MSSTIREKHSLKSHTPEKVLAARARAAIPNSSVVINSNIKERMPATVIQTHIQNAPQFRMHSNLIGNIVAVTVQIGSEQIARMRLAGIVLSDADYLAVFKGKGKVAAADCGGDFDKALCFHWKKAKRKLHALAWRGILLFLTIKDFEEIFSIL